MLMLAKLCHDDGAAEEVGGRRTCWPAQEVPPQEQQEAGAEPSHLEVKHKHQFGHQRQEDVPTLLGLTHKHPEG